MSQTVELPDSVYAALKNVADATGTTPAEWIAAHLPKAPVETVNNGKTAADLFAGRIGRFRSSGQETLSEDTGKKFTEYVVQKKREGVL